MGAAILVLDRGACPFTTKAYHGQLAGADAVMIVDNVDESLVTLDSADDDKSREYVANISVPVGLVTKATGALIEPLLSADPPQPILVMLNWTDVLPHPDERVEWEFWTNSGDDCGTKCDQQKAFIREFAPVAKQLDQGGYAQFTPHYVTWLCPPAYVDSPECVGQCINDGRYCCPDPDEDLDRGYSGRDVVIENLRSLCVFSVANETSQPWKWWDYQTQFEETCTMASGNYGSESCATTILQNLGLDVERWRACVGDPDANALNPKLEAEQMAQQDDGRRGDITLLPTIVINERQYRGKIDRASVLRSICAGFVTGQAPPLCDDEGYGSNQCAEDAEGSLACAADADGNGLTGCESTTEWPFYRCVCPRGTTKVTKRDGGFTCDAMNGCRAAVVDTPSCSCDRCWCQTLAQGDIKCHEEPPSACTGGANPGGCWSARGVNACRDNIDAKRVAGMAGDDPAAVPATVCACPDGFEGDGLHCADVDECARGECAGERMRCTNTFGSFECACEGEGRVLVADENGGRRCIAERAEASVGLLVLAVVASCAILAGGGFLVYRWRLRSYMDAEIRAIMSQYMPLEEQDAGPNANNPFGDDDDDADDDAQIRRNVRAINDA